VLAARELSIVDMFNLANEHVQGIVTEEGGLTSHAAIFARSMRIPTITGVEGLLRSVEEGDFVILDATEGVLRVNPDDLVRRQYAQAGLEAETAEEGPPDWAQLPARTRDGQTVLVSAMCGNLPEVEQGASFGMQGVGLYRTELLYLLERDMPSRETLVRHYASVVERANGGPITFRLLNVDATLEVRYLHKDREQNPQLGRSGIRALLGRETVLRRQLQAILLASPGVETRIAVPFVTDCSELRRVKEILFEERIELRKTRESFQDSVALGAVIETPASLLGMRDLAREADFLTVNLDSLLQYVLAADRENADLAHLVEIVHPFALRAIAKLSRVCEEASRPLSVFGLSALAPHNLRLLLGAGVRGFAVPPSSLRDFLSEIGKIDQRAAARSARVTARASCLEETQSLVQGYRHGYAGP
jgi:phosphoenolpyruvate-protein kinase (PTS system EI component)